MCVRARERAVNDFPDSVVMKQELLDSQTVEAVPTPQGLSSKSEPRWQERLDWRWPGGLSR